MIYLPKFPELENGYNSYLLSLSLDRNISIIPSNIVETGSIAPGINKGKEVRFNGSSGFKKDSTNTDSSDDLEIVINWIGRFLNIKMAKAYRMLSLTGDPIALVSENVVQTNDLEFFTMCDMKGKLANHVDMINYDGWVDRYFELMRHKAYPDVPESFEYLAQTEEEVNDVIELGYRVINHIYHDEISKANAIFDYEKMLFLDTLIGQVDRTVGNYGFIYNSNEDSYLFAPLFDNSTLRKPYTETNVCSEARVSWHNYDDYFTNNNRIDNESPTDAYLFDYNVVVEYRCKNKIYHRNMLIKNTIKLMNVHSKILVYYERKNPLNVYIF